MSWGAKPKTPPIRDSGIFEQSTSYPEGNMKINKQQTSPEPIILMVAYGLNALVGIMLLIFLIVNP